MIELLAVLGIAVMTVGFGMIILIEDVYLPKVFNYEGDMSNGFWTSLVIIVGVLIIYSSIQVDKDTYRKEQPVTQGLVEIDGVVMKVVSTEVESSKIVLPGLSTLRDELDSLKRKGTVYKTMRTDAADVRGYDGENLLMYVKIDFNGEDIDSRSDMGSYLTSFHVDSVELFASYLEGDVFSEQGEVVMKTMLESLIQERSDRSTAWEFVNISNLEISPTPFKD